MCAVLGFLLEAPSGGASATVQPRQSLLPAGLQAQGGAAAGRGAMEGFEEERRADSYRAGGSFPGRRDSG